MAGRAGFGGLANALNMGRTAVGTDWSNPGAAISAALGFGWRRADSLDASLKNNFGVGLLDIAGKLWTLPIHCSVSRWGPREQQFKELAIYFGLTPNAPGIDFGNNGIRFTNNAFVEAIRRSRLATRCYFPRKCPPIVVFTALPSETTNKHIPIRPSFWDLCFFPPGRWAPQ